MSSHASTAATFANHEAASLNKWQDKIILGDCLEVLRQMPSNTINLIVTSPPYADSRKKTYGGVHPDKYVEWFLPVAGELRRVLKDDGTFILNIKEKAVDGERHVYVLELILELKKRGWLWTEEYVWHKKNCAPGKWPNRFRDAWERCLQFKLNMFGGLAVVDRRSRANETDKKLENEC